MKNEYRSMMENLTLSPAARSAIEEQIAAAPKSGKRTAHPLRRIAAAAACLLLVLAVAGTPFMAQGTSMVEDILASIAETLGYKSISPSYVSDDGNFVAAIAVDENDNKVCGTYHMAGTPPTWLSESNGRLYFTGNGEQIDITDQISFEKAFTYIYTDTEQIIHYIAVGGVYETDLYTTRIGWAEWIQNAPGTEPMDPHSIDGWIGGYADNHMDIAENTEYPWYTSAAEEFEIPWIW